MNQKKVWVTLGCIGILLMVVGVSYAYWSLTFTQDQNNVVMTDCFEIEFIEGNAINLIKAYPVSDNDGMKNTPYIFTIKNVCDGSANYQINLETMTHDGKKLPDQYLKIDLMESNISKITSKLESSLNTEPTIEGAVNAYQLLVGELKPREEKEFSLRIWMHSEVTAENKDSMNAIYNGKISVITSYALTSLIDTIKLVPKVTEGTGLYEVDHQDAEITYTTDDIAIQNLKQTELRYAGANPNNYVEFNNELWRIIGLVNTPEGSRVKLIRNESIGDFSWDSSSSSINEGYGINEWSTSKIMNLLNNGAYYNRTSGTCYSGANSATISCDLSSTGLTEDAKNMIDTITWNIGSNDEKTGYYNISTNFFYNFERSNDTGKICSSGTRCNDNIERTTSWGGQVGLMNPSDYGYATSGGSTTNRMTCLDMVLYNWNNSEVSDCKNNDWLYKAAYQWTINSDAYSQNSSSVFSVYNAGYVSSNDASSANATRPSIYLKCNVKVDGGEGTESLPYHLKA